MRSLCSIALITFERRERVCATLRELKTAYPSLPTVIVDNAGADGTGDAIARAFPEVALIRSATNIGAAARNLAVRRVTTPYVAACDDDSWWEAGSIERAVAILEREPGVALVAARIVVQPDGTIDPNCLLMRESPLQKRAASPGRAIAAFMGNAVVFRRAAFLAAGGYDSRYFLGAEESLLAVDLIEAGYELLYVDACVVHHAPSNESRNGRQRETLTARNRCWTALLRFSLRSVVKRLIILLARATFDARSREALAGVVRAMPWLLRERRVVSERTRRTVDIVVENR